MRTVSKLSRRAVHRKSLEFSPNSTTIKNNERWYDDQDVEIKANRCGTISRGKINGYWYMVGSESSHKFGSVRKISKKKTGYIEDINIVRCAVSDVCTQVWLLLMLIHFFAEPRWGYLDL